MMATEQARPAIEPGWRRHPLSRLVLSSEPWRAALFLLSSFALGVFWFALLVSAIAAGSGLAVSLIGIPILIAAVYIWQQGARIERWRAGTLLHEPIDDPYRPAPEGSWWGRFKALVTDPAIWRDLLYLFLLFPLGVIEFVILTVSLSIPASMMAMPIAVVTGNEANIGIGDVMGWRIDTVSESLIVFAVGVPLLVLGLLAIVGTSRAHVAFARTLLGPDERARLE